MPTSDEQSGQPLHRKRRRPLRPSLIITVVIQFALAILRIKSTDAVSKLLISANKSPTSFLPTRVTGFGSRRNTEIKVTKRTEPDSATRPLSLYLGQQNDEKHDEILVYSEPHNTTIKILQNGSVVRNESNSTPTEMWAKLIGLFGVYKVPSGHIWVWIVDSELIYEAPYLPSNQTSAAASIQHSVPWWSLHRVTQLHLIHLPFSSYKSAHASMKHYRAQQREEKRQLALLRQALKDHEWYYSKGWVTRDLTRRFQLSLGPQNEKSNDDDIVHQPPDDKFFWNQAVVDPVLEKYREHQAEKNDNNMYGILLDHVIPITSAFCGTQTNVTFSSGNSACAYDQVLVTRRSRFRAGTRYTRRGADASGAVANFAETEQILFFWNRSNAGDRILKSVCSHVQTRGSIPLPWSSPTDIKTYRPRVRIGTNPLAHARALRQHLIDHAYYLPASSSHSAEAQKGPTILLVDLVDKKSDQGRLGRAFDAVLNAVLDVYAQQPDPHMPWLAPDQIVHLWFDFHAEVKAGGWNRLSSLVNEVKPILDQHGYFEAAPQIESHDCTNSTFLIKRVQKGIVRTNCMDCLDRTNVVQSLFARHVLFSQVAATSKVPVAYKSAFRQKSSALPWLMGEVAHRLLWADNADAISRLYAGTPALKGDFTRTGKRTKKGALEDGMNSLQRYYLNNFLDADRQEGIDLLTGHHPFNKLASLLDDFNEMSVPRSLGELRPLYNNFEQHMQEQKEHLGFPVADKNANSRFQKFSPENKLPTSEQTIHFNWLPGDLQSHVWNLLYPQRNYCFRANCSTYALEGVHRRAGELLPWWCASGDDDQDIL